VFENVAQSRPGGRPGGAGLSGVSRATAARRVKRAPRRRRGILAAVTSGSQSAPGEPRLSAGEQPQRVASEVVEARGPLESVPPKPPAPTARRRGGPSAKSRGGKRPQPEMPVAVEARGTPVPVPAKPAASARRRRSGPPANSGRGKRPQPEMPVAVEGRGPPAPVSAKPTASASRREPLARSRVVKHPQPESPVAVEARGPPAPASAKPAASAGRRRGGPPPKSGRGQLPQPETPVAIEAQGPPASVPTKPAASVGRRRSGLPATRGRGKRPRPETPGAVEAGGRPEGAVPAGEAPPPLSDLAAASTHAPPAPRPPGWDAVWRERLSRHRRILLAVFLGFLGGLFVYRVFAPAEPSVPERVTPAAQKPAVQRSELGRAGPERAELPTAPGYGSQRAPDTGYRPPAAAPRPQYVEPGPAPGDYRRRGSSEPTGGRDWGDYPRGPSDQAGGYYPPAPSAGGAEPGYPGGGWGAPQGTRESGGWGRAVGDRPWGKVDGRPDRYRKGEQERATTYPGGGGAYPAPSPPPVPPSGYAPSPW